MSLPNAPDTASKIQNSILSFSSQATTAFRWFSNEDFLNMMSEMSIEEIKADLERCKTLEEYEICKKIEFVIKEKLLSEAVDLNILMEDVNI
jgi:hypothetical protein